MYSEWGLIQGGDFPWGNERAKSGEGPNL